MGLSPMEVAYIDHRLVAFRRRVMRGERLFQAGDRFESLFAIWTGCFKTCVASRDGREQVTGFLMGGDLLGMDGISTRRHEVDAVALEDAQVCVIPYAEFEALTHELPALMRQFNRLMSREIVRSHGVMMLLGSMFAEERLAAFLLNLTHRLQLRGFSASTVVLRMSREEIGSYLGLKLETVSRTFSKFQSNGLLFVRHRQIRVTDPVGLQHLIDGRSN